MMLEFGVLGPLQVSRDGKPVAIGSAMLRRLLAALLCRPGRPLQAGVLIDALWDGAPPRSARKTLHVYVRRLRLALGEQGRIQHDVGGYSAVVAPDELDALRFSRLVIEGRSAWSRGDPESARGSLERALGLWRGTAYADIEDVSLVADEVRRLEEDRLLAHEELAIVNLALGRAAEMMGDLATMVDTHPYRDRLRACLMLALCRLGRQVEALEVYRRTRALLNDELGVEPGPLLRRIHEAVLQDGDVEGAAAEILAFPAVTEDSGRPVHSVPAAVVPSQLPPDIPDFTGRREQVAALHRLLTDAAGPVAVVTGRAGAGKTALAVHTAHRVRDLFPDGQLFVDLHGAEARPADPAEVLARFLAALGVDGRALPPGLEERAALYRTVLADRRALVVLDNAASEGQVRPLLPGGPGCRALVTGRGGLTGLGARPLRLDTLDAESARVLLARIAGPDRVEAEPAAAAEIVRLCGRLPLAVRIAGARLAAREHWDLAHLAERLRQGRLDELTVGDLSVRAGLALSYHALPEATRRAFRLLGLLDASDFAPWVLAAILDVGVPEAEEHIERLLDARLLDPAGHGRRRYRFHDLVRLYARERAAAEDDPDLHRRAISRALGGWLAVAEAADRGLAERVVSDIRGTAPRWYPGPAYLRELVNDPLAWFDAERHAIAEGVAQADRADLDELAWELSSVAVNYYTYRGAYADWADTHQLALRACMRSGNRWGEAVMVRNLAYLRMTGLKTPPGIVLSRAEATMTAFEESGERRGTLDLLGLWAFALRHKGDSERALAHVDDAMATAERIGYRLAQCRLWYLRAVTLREWGRYSEATACARRCLDLALQVGTAHDRVLALWELSGACRDPEALPGAVRDVRAGLHLCRHRREQLLEAYLLLALADLHLRFGLPGAREPIERALTVFGDYAVPFGRAVGLRLLGEFHRTHGSPEQALAHLSLAVRLTGTLRNTHEQALALNSLGHAHRARGDHAAAERAWLTAHELFTKIANTSEASRTKALALSCTRGRSAD